MYYVKRQLDDFTGLEGHLSALSALGKKIKAKKVKLTSGKYADSAPQPAGCACPPSGYCCPPGQLGVACACPPSPDCCAGSKTSAPAAPSPELQNNRCGTCPDENYYCVDKNKSGADVKPYCAPVPPNAAAAINATSAASTLLMINLDDLVKKWLAKFPKGNPTANDGAFFIDPSGPGNWNANGYITLSDGTKYTRNQLEKDVRAFQSELNAESAKFVTAIGGTGKALDLMMQGMTEEQAKTVIPGSQNLSQGEMAGGVSQLMALGASSNIDGENFLNVYLDLLNTSKRFSDDIAKMPATFKTMQKVSKTSAETGRWAAKLFGNKVINQAKSANTQVGLKGLGRSPKTSSASAARKAIVKQAIALGTAIVNGKNLSAAQVNLLTSPTLSQTIGNLYPITAKEFDAVFGKNASLYNADLHGLGAFSAKSAWPWILAGGLILLLAKKK